MTAAAGVPVDADCNLPEVGYTALLAVPCQQASMQLLLV